MPVWLVPNQYLQYGRSSWKFVCCCAFSLSVEAPRGWARRKQWSRNWIRLESQRIVEVESEMELQVQQAVLGGFNEYRVEDK
jgi:hypothetical protein